MRPTTITAANAFRPTEPTRLPGRSEATMPTDGGHGRSIRQQVRFVVATTASV